MEDLLLIECNVTMCWTEENNMTFKPLILIVAAALALSSSPAAEAQDDTAERWSFLITYGEESCPPAQDDEIVVCAERPESERYRIPKNVRVKKRVSTGVQSLASATRTLDGLARQSRPNGCSVSGSNGFTGCQAAAIRRWFAERNLIEAAKERE